MIIYTHSITARLQYIADFIGSETTGETIQIITEIEHFRAAAGPRINYSDKRITADELWLKPHDILFEKNIKQQHVECFDNKEYKAFFKTEGDCSFDIFAASFYLLSRYEEYLPHQKDEFGRYAHENSLAFRENFLQLPLVNIWIREFRKILQQKFPGIELINRPFHFLPTYDIDEGYCYRYKSWWRTLGGYSRSILKGHWEEARERRRVLEGWQDDPYDSLKWIKELHFSKYPSLSAYFFFLVAAHRGRYDKNISPYKKQWQELIRNLFEINPAQQLSPQPKLMAGIHPSWQSGDKPDLIKKELDILENEIGLESKGSRQHYIRFTLPGTFRQLIKAGTTTDFSMGYGSINGFRASAASAFYWFDLEKNEPTSLLLYPFCFMDANSFYEQKYLPEQALKELMNYFEVIRSVNGTMITIWHNTILGKQKRFTGWKEMYEEFLGKIYTASQ